MHPKNLHTLISRTRAARVAFRQRDDAEAFAVVNAKTILDADGPMSPAEQAFGKGTIITPKDMVEVRYWFDVPRRIKKNAIAALQKADKDLPMKDRATWAQSKLTLARERAEDVN